MWTVRIVVVEFGPVFNITWYDHNGIEIVRCSKYILYGKWKIPCLSFLVSMTGSIWWQESDSRRRRMFIFQSTCKCIRILQYLETSQNWQKVNKAMATRKPVVEATPTGYFGNGVKELNFKYLSLKSNHLWFLTIWFGLVFGNHLHKTIPYSLHH